MNTSCLHSAVIRSPRTFFVARLGLLTLGLVAGSAALTVVVPTLAPVSVAEAGVVAKDTPQRVELEFWRAIKDSTNPDEFEAYLELYPDGKFAPLAKIRARSLRAKQGASSEETKSKVSAPAKPRPAVTSPTAAPAKIKASTDATTVSTDLPAGVFRDCGMCPEMVDVASGQFVMGSGTGDPASAPARPVTIDYGFAAGRHEITVGQWAQCVAEEGCKENARHTKMDSTSPAVNLSWRDASDYVYWLGDYTGRPYRLPTEAEWEYFARGGSSDQYWWGTDLIPGQANCRDCGGAWDKKVPAAVSSLPSNGFGLHGTSGGVSEWVADCWNSSHADAPSDGTARVSARCSQRVLRGGSWRNDARYVTSDSRLSYEASVRYVTNGMRVILDTRKELAD